MPLTLCYGFLWLLNSFSVLSFPFYVIYITNLTALICYECVEIMLFRRYAQHVMASNSLINNIYHIKLIYKFFCVIKPTRCTNFTNLFCHETLRVSDSSSVHHQEFIHCTLSNGICHTGGTSWSRSKAATNRYDIYRC